MFFKLGALATKSCWCRDLLIAFGSLSSRLQPTWLLNSHITPNKNCNKILNFSYSLTLQLKPKCTGVVNILWTSPWFLTGVEHSAADNNRHCPPGVECWTLPVTSMRHSRCSRAAFVGNVKTVSSLCKLSCQMKDLPLHVCSSLSSNISVLQYKLGTSVDRLTQLHITIEGLLKLMLLNLTRT